MNLIWNTADTTRELQTALRALAEKHPLREATAAGPGAAGLTCRPGGSRCVAHRTLHGLQISGGSLPAQLRAVGVTLAGLLPEGATLEEAIPFTTGFAPPGARPPYRGVA